MARWTGPCNRELLLRWRGGGVIPAGRSSLRQSNLPAVGRRIGDFVGAPVRSAGSRPSGPAGGGGGRFGEVAVRSQHEPRDPYPDERDSRHDQPGAQHENAPECQEYLGAAEASAASLLSLLNDVLDFSKVEAGRVELSPAMFRVSGPVRDACANVLPKAREKGLQLTWRTDGQCRNGWRETIAGFAKCSSTCSETRQVH